MKRCTNNNTGILLAALLTLIVVDTYFFNNAGYGAMSAVIAILLVGLSALMKLEYAFYIIIFCFPFASLLKLSYSSISVLPIMYLVVILRLLLIRRIKLRTDQWLLFVAFVALQIIGFSAYNAPATSLISFCVSLLFVVCSASFFADCETDNNRMFKTASVFLTVAVIENVLLSDIFPDMLRIIAPDKQAALEQTERFGAMFVEPNEFSQAVLVAIGLLITLLPMIKGVAKLLDIAAIIFLGISGYRTYSKSYVLTLFFLFIVLLFLHLRITAKEKDTSAAVKKILPIILVLVVGCVLLYYYVILPTLEHRESSGFLTGRAEIWLSYIGAFFSRFDIVFWGAGIGNVTYLNQMDTFIGTQAPHNMYLEFAIQFGILGLLVLAFIATRLFKQAGNKRGTYFILASLAFLITSVGISVNANDCIFIILLLATMPYTQKKKIEERTETV